MTEQVKPPRKTPCASCPYRKSVPSGIWDTSEYEKLPRYDGETFEQTAIAVFMCHQGCGDVCAGWLGHRDPEELLAVRLGLIRGELDERSLSYTTEVPLFTSGAEAAAHGLAELDAPGTDAELVITKIVRKRSTQQATKTEHPSP